ncbi:hypothetical protein [Desulfobacterium sp. N47]|uniref:Uncharacterized protein n=1 Tax=uncultured Desulfobacterium sp. TaxID=201089 RepID=E1YEL0_9BACT|nr:unknown protein [uncultured Desulfobacterium sp.]
MISEFQNGLAELLNERLQTPFKGNVAVSDGSAINPSNKPVISIGVISVKPGEADMGNKRPRIVPGNDDPRAVLYLSCMVSLLCYPSNLGGRSQCLQAVESVLYILNAYEVKNGSALPQNADPGYLIQNLVPKEASLPLLSDTNREYGEIRIGALGWFWPVGAPGITGEPIQKIPITATID